MFVKHESTRRLLCRAAFLWLCALPTLLVSAWCVFTLTPWHAAWQRERWQSRAEQFLGVSVLIGHVSYPQYNVALLQGVSVVDPETDATIADIRTIEATQNDRGWVLLASHAELRSAHVQTLFELIHRRGLCALHRQAPRVEATIRELTVQNEKTGETFHDIGFALEPSTSGVQASLEFRIAGLAMAEPAQWVVTRHRNPEKAVTGWILKTKGTPLPCALFTEIWPPIKRLGRDCHFDGVVTYDERPVGWDSEINVRLSNVDLDQLITSQFPHKLSGVADVIVTSAKVRAGRLLEAAGSLQADDGVVSRSLLEALAREDTLQLQLSSRVQTTTDPLWRYRQLSFGFKMDGQGLGLKGLCTKSVEGVVLTDQTGALLKEAISGSVPPVAIMRALAPQNELQVPASQETRSLVELLPVPAIKPPLDDNGSPRRPYSPLRFGDRLPENRSR